VTTDWALRFRRLDHLVGNTPLLGIDLSFRGRDYRIYAKAEQFNLTGSIKDRMAVSILRGAYESGAIEPGGRIVEATSGNTGIAFSAVGRAMGHPVTIFMPDWMSEERKVLIRSFGADIRLVSHEEGGFLGSIAMADEMARATPGSFAPRQFESEANPLAHERTTGPEIWWQLRIEGLRPDAFVAGVGTGGTVVGVGRFLRSREPDVRIHPLEPENSPTLSTGHQIGHHRIQGISDEFIPAICKLDELDEIVSVDDGDSIIMTQRLAAELGIGVGISSGANLLGALKIAERLGPESVVVTIFTDDNKKYLSTDLMRTEPVKSGHLTPEIELKGFVAFKRACITCCDRADCERLPFLEAARDTGLATPLRSICRLRLIDTVDSPAGAGNGERETGRWPRVPA
jgi:cysteine synthase A